MYVHTVLPVSVGVDRRNCPVLSLCLTWVRGIAWDLREMGSAWGRGVREGQAPKSREDKQSTPSKEGDNMRKREEGRTSRA